MNRTTNKINTTHTPTWYNTLFFEKIQDHCLLLYNFQPVLTQHVPDFVNEENQYCSYIPKNAAVFLA